MDKGMGIAGINIAGLDAAPRHRAIESTRTALRFLAAVGFTGAGLAHFRNPAFFKNIVPPGFPAPGLLVAVSGIAEIAGGVGLLVPRLRMPAMWGLLTLLVAVFPANVYMAVAPEKIPDMHFPRWALWARLPLQPLMMAWVWWVGKTTGSRSV